MRGLEVRHNNNGFTILRLHYTADPDKDPETEKGKLWYDKARKGMPASSWEKEYEIDYFARSGELIYPEFGRATHLIEPFEIPKDWTRWMAIDPGLRNETGMLWCAVNKDGDIIFYREHYVKEKTVDWHAAEVKVLEKPFKEEIYQRLIDPAAEQRSMLNRESIRDEYGDHGVFTIPANNDVESGINLVKQFLMVDEEIKKPKVFFFRTLTHLVDEITSYRWHQDSEMVLRQRSPKEKPAEKADHLMDCLRYICMDNPYYVAKMTRSELDMADWKMKRKRHRRPWMNMGV